MKDIKTIVASVIAVMLMIVAFTACGEETDNMLTGIYWYSESDSIALRFNKNGTVELYAMEDTETYLAKVDGTYSFYEDNKLKIVYTNSEPISGTYGVANGKLMFENDNGNTTLYTALDIGELKVSANSIPLSGETETTETLASIEVEEYSDDPERFVTLGEYKGAKIEAYDRTAYDNEINIRLAELINEKAIGTVITDRAVKEGDIVNITFNAYVNEYLQTDESAENTVVYIGNGDYIDGFEEGLIGLMPGTERFQLNLTFPENYYDSELAGEKVRYAVTVNYIIEYTEEELNDSSKTGYESYEALLEDIRTQIFEHKDQLAMYERMNAAWLYAYENAAFTSMPNGAVEEYYNNLLNYYTYYAVQKSMTVEKYAESQLGMTYNEFKNALTQISENAIKSKLLVYAIAKAEAIEIPDDEYETRAMEYAAQDGYSSFEDIKNAYGEETLYVTVLRDIVLEMLEKTVVEVPVQ